ncbi:hypothetical protein Bca4012_099972 [Brassica carinata]|uniref:Uncharacterized protein n=1 Tax=Brassica carinata TaxID=52824 RepID=A0A8X7PK75_BRACI|nr:hypothetical protein Bca52824_082554 [Brassica carinata]
MLWLFTRFMSWEREEEAGGEVGTTMVSRSELRCGEDDATSSSRDVDKGCVGVIRVDDNCVDVIDVDMRLGVKCEVVRQEVVR